MAKSNLNRYPELPEFGIRDYIPFLLLRNSPKLSERQNSEVYESLADSGYWRAIGIYGVSTMFSVFFYAVAKVSGGHVDNKLWLIHLGPLLIAVVLAGLYMQLKRNRQRYSYKTFILVHLILCPIGGITWGVASSLLSSVGGILSEVSLSVIGPASVFTVVWLATFPLGCWLWLVSCTISFLVIQSGASDFFFYLTIVIFFTTTAFVLCLFFFLTHIRATLDRINTRDQQRLTSLLLKQIEKYSADFLWQTDNKGNLIYGSLNLIDMCRRNGHTEPIHFPSVFNANTEQSRLLQSKIEDSSRVVLFQAALVLEDYLEWWSISGEALYEPDGQKVGFSGFASNITGLKRAEESRNREHSYAIVKKMASTIAHDFNNYLGSISGNLELMAIESQRYGESPTLLNFKNNAARAIGDAGNLTRQLLLMGENDILTPNPVKLVDIVLSASSDVLAIYPTGLKISSQIDDSLFLHVDRRQLARALRNVIENAALAMEGSGQITISAEKHARGTPKIQHILSTDSQLSYDGYCSISIRDEGPGFDADLLEVAFQPFTTTRRRSGGTGIGLAMVQGFCQQSDGAARLRNLTHGAVVELILPAAEGVVEETVPENPTDTSCFHGNHVVLLEDEPELRETTAQLLIGHGMGVTSVESLAQMRKILPGLTKCDYLIADMELNDGYGYEILDPLHEQFPHASVVFVTGYINQLELKRASANQPVLLKPVDSQTLFKAMLDAKARNPL